VGPGNVLSFPLYRGGSPREADLFPLSPTLKITVLLCPPLHVSLACSVRRAFRDGGPFLHPPDSCFLKEGLLFGVFSAASSALVTGTVPAFLSSGSSSTRLEPPMVHLGDSFLHLSGPLLKMEPEYNNLPFHSAGE